MCSLMLITCSVKKLTFGIEVWHPNMHAFLFSFAASRQKNVKSDRLTGSLCSDL